MINKFCIPGYEGLYEIDDNGDVYSISRWINHKYGKVYLEGRKLKPIKHSTGYLTVGLTKEGKSKSIRLHRLVALLLVPNPFNKPHVNHIDANKHNYHPSNLEWVTPQENMDHAVVNGLTAAGERNSGSKLSHSQIKEAFGLVKFNNQKIQDVAEIYKVNRNTLSKAFKRLGLLL